MKEIIISGGKSLSGRIEPSGSKNAALPIIFATIAAPGISYISNVSDIGDTAVAVKILECFGAKVKRVGNITEINTENLEYVLPSRELTRKIRASSYLIGACLARFGKFHLSEFGGCSFCNRPIDMHLYAAEKLGAEYNRGEISAKKLVGAKIDFEKQSVGATINSLIMATAAEGETVLFGVAKEPHVRALVEFLVSAGADITENEDSFIVKKSNLHGGSVKVIPDMIEAGTYLLLGPMTEGSVTVTGAAALELESFLEPLSLSGVSVSYDGEDITLSGTPKRPISIKTAPHPGYPTDLQPQIAPLMAKYFGGRIEECVWQNRFSYLDSLMCFGVMSERNTERALIRPSIIHSSTAAAPDLRGGAALAICALAARGESKIKNADMILRGYSDFESKLKSLGANIKLYDNSANEESTACLNNPNKTKEV